MATRRGLEIKKVDGADWAEFNSNGKRVKKRLMPDEAIKGKRVMGDEFDEDWFCSNIV